MMGMHAELMWRWSQNQILLKSQSVAFNYKYVTNYCCYYYCYLLFGGRNLLCKYLLCTL